MKAIFFISAFLFSVMFSQLCAAKGTKFNDPKQWEKCEDKVIKSNKFEVADEITWKVTEVCGQKPMTKEDCNGIYYIYSDECKSFGGCNEDDMLYSKASDRFIQTLNIDFKQYDSICRKVCKDKKVLTRNAFGRKICSGK